MHLECKSTLHNWLYTLHNNCERSELKLPQIGFFSKKSFSKSTIFSRQPNKVSTFVQFFSNLLNKSLHKKICRKAKTYF